MLNTTAWPLTLHREGLLSEALDLVERINTGRATPLVAVRESRAYQKNAVNMAAPEFRTMNDDLKGNTLADVLEKLEKGKIGHRAAMDWLNVKTYDELVEIMHSNGRLMPGHQPMRVAPETRALVRRIFRSAAPPTGRSLVSCEEFGPRRRGDHPGR